LVPPPRNPARAFHAQLRAALPASVADRLEPLDVAASCAALDSRLAAGGLAACVLGLGPDGHVAMNQPNSAVDSPTRLAEIAPANLARLGDVAPATHALTLGIATVLSAESVILVVDGPGKADALARVESGPEGPDSPASWLRRHPRCVVLVRADA
jgi:glucosamine-6-phosphate deaminase